VALATVPGQWMKELHQWVLTYTVEVHWSLNGLNGFLPPPPLVALVRSSTLSLWEKELEPLFWLCRVASIIQIVEGSGEPAPFVLMQLSFPAQSLILVRCEHLVSPSLSVLLLHPL
jgi:hypothetical protein